MTKNDDKRIPALRFKGFNDDWAQHKLRNILIVNSGKDYKELNKGNVPVYGTGGYMMISVDHALSHKDAVGIGRKGSINKPQYLKAPFWTVDTLFFMTTKENNNLEFIYSLSQTINWKKYDESTGLPSLSKNTINNISIKTPSYFEQKKIGKIISQIDTLLSLQQRKEKLLKQIQQAIYYNIYPEYGTKIPIIRHREFNKDWSIVSFNKLYKKSKEKNDLTYGEDKIISVAKMYFKHESQNSSKDYLKTYNVFKKGDIAFEGNRSEGFSHGRFVQNNIGDGIVSHVFDVFTPLNKENLNYWKYAIHNEHIMKYVLVKSTTKATMMNNLSTKDFLKQKIAVPNSCEMKKISHLLKGLDDQLEFSKRKIKILTKVKQFLLQNMFI